MRKGRIPFFFLALTLTVSGLIFLSLRTKVYGPIGTHQAKNQKAPAFLTRGKSVPEQGKMARSVALLENAREAYRSINGYQAIFDKQELREDGSWNKERTFIKFNKPFTIFLGWMEGNAKGRQVLYSQGDFEGKMMVRVPGFFNLLPLIRLKPDDPRLAKTEKHSITTAGIGYFLEEFAESFYESKEKNQLKILSLRDEVIEGEKGTLVDVLYMDSEDGYPRTGVVFSKSHGLPIEVRLYSDEDHLVESYRYLKLTVDPNRDDDNFKQHSDARMFRLYQKVARASWAD